MRTLELEKLGETLMEEKEKYVTGMELDV